MEIVTNVVGCDKSLIRVLLIKRRRWMVYSLRQISRRNDPRANKLRRACQNVKCNDLFGRVGGGDTSLFRMEWRKFRSTQADFCSNCFAARFLDCRKRQCRTMNSNLQNCYFSILILFVDFAVICCCFYFAAEECSVRTLLYCIYLIYEFNSDVIINIGCFL